jgi:uncharacterized protein involved in tellurium resistance
VKHVFKIFINLFILEQLDSWGIDGDVLKINMPTEVEVSTLVSTSEKQYRTRLGIGTSFWLSISSIFRLFVIF